MKAVNFLSPVNYGTVKVHDSQDFFFHESYHRHAEIQITLILSGRGTLVVDNFFQRFQAGDVFIIGANKPHIYRLESDSISDSISDSFCPYEPRAIHLLFEYNEKFRELFTFPEFDSIRRFLDNDHNFQLLSPQLQTGRDKIMDIYEKSDLYRFLAFLDLLQFFADEVGQWKSISTGMETHNIVDVAETRLRNIYAFARANYMNDITLEEIASVANLSPTAFCKYFKKRTMKTWLMFLNEMRIHEVCRKLIHTDDFIGSVAYSSGFTTLTTFNRAFRRVMGVSPNHYRKKYRKNKI